MRRTKEDAGKTKQDIIVAAIKVFDKQGYAATRLSDIAVEAGITRGAIYWHFKNKLDLYSYLIENGLDKFFGIIGRELDRDLPFLEKTRNIFTAFLKIDGFEFRQFLFIKEFFISIKLYEELRPVLQIIIRKADEILEKFCAEIDEAKETGELKTDINGRDLSITILNYLAMLGEKLTDTEKFSEFLDFDFEKIEYDAVFFLEMVFNGFNSLKTE